MKVAVVTGSSSGSGLALTYRLLEKDYMVIGVDKSPPSPHIYSDKYKHYEVDLGNLGSDIARYNLPKSKLYQKSPMTGNVSEIHPVPLRVLSFRDFLESVNPVAEEELSKVELVAHCAGMNFIKPFPEIQISDYQKVHAVNVLAGLWILQSFLDELKNNRGMYMTIVSIAARVAMSHSTVYCSSKAAQHSAVEVLGRELSRSHNITVMGVAPGKLQSKVENPDGIGSKMSTEIDQQVMANRGWTYEEAKKYESANRYANEWLTPEEVSDFMMYFISNPKIAESFRGVVVPMFHIP